MSKRLWEKKTVHPPVREPDHLLYLSACLHLSGLPCFAQKYCPNNTADIHLALPGSAPPSPPQVMRPSLPNETLFEQGLSNKLHNSLVFKNKSKLKQSTKQPTGAIPSTTSAALVAPSNKKATLPPVQHQSCTPYLHMPISGLSSSVTGSKEKKSILKEYVSKFGSAHKESIITKKKGKLDLNEPLHFVTSSWKGMKPSSNKYYRVKDLTIYNVVTIVIQEYTAFSKNELSSIRLINTDFSKMIPKLKHWLQTDFSTLHKPQLNYKNQMQIDPHQVCTANAAMAHLGLDPGRFVQWMSGEYTSQL
jgi:hypothetical protein